VSATVEADLIRLSEEIERARAGPRATLVELRRRRDELIVRLHHAGLNNRQIAALAGVTRWWVGKVLKRAERVLPDWFPCCEHCGCKPDDRAGHDDICSHGCND
jgi:hypothetical protein